MCEDQKPAFVVTLHWDSEIKPTSFFLPYGGDLKDLDAVFDYLTNDEDVLEIGELGIPEGIEVQVSVSTYCEKCRLDIGFHITQAWVLSAEPDAVGKFLADDLLAEMADMPLSSIIFVSNFVEELAEWLGSFEEEENEYLEPPSYVPYVPEGKFSGLN